MHEYSIVQSLVDSVDVAAKQTPDGVVLRVLVEIGGLSGVDVDLLTTAFETFREGTCCESAELLIARVSTQWTCPSCDRPIASGSILRCPDCNEPARLTAGDEILLRQIEMEVPDVSGLRLR
jgi:hydrogenase nickel incorporation protein HypA/HybF